MLFLRHCLFACTVFLSLFVSGQECQLIIEGKILDYHDRSPLVGALIQVNKQERYVQTDLNGNFQITGLCPGVYELEVSHPECRTTFKVFRIDENLNTTILLEHHLQQLEEVQVVGTADPNKTNSGAEVVLEKKVLERYASGSLGDALKEISGVSSINTGAAIVKPVIQGLYGSRVLVMNNNVRMQDMEWGEDHAPNVDLNSLDKVRLIKGSAALKYGGDAIGGVIVLENDWVPSMDSIWGSTSLSAVSNGKGGSLTTELNRSWSGGFYLKGQASYRLIGDLRAPDYILSNTGNRQLGLNFEAGNRSFEQGWSVNYSYFDATIGVLRASHIGNVDDLIRSINNRSPEVIEPFTYSINEPRQEVSHHLGKAKYYRRISGLGTWEIQYDVQRNRRFEFDVNRTQTQSDIPSIDLTLTTHSLQTDLSLDRSEKISLDFGLLGRYQDNFADPQTGVRRLIPDYTRLELGAYGSAEWMLSDKLTADAGLRYDFSRIDALKFYRTSRWEERGYDQSFPELVVEDLGTQLLTNPVFDYNNFSAAAGIRWTPDTSWDLTLNLARSQRAPNPSELFSDGLHHSAARIELGDLRINSEVANRITATAEYKSTFWGVSLNPYLNSISNFILLEPTEVEFTIRGAFPVWSYRQTDAMLAGMDLSGYFNWMPQLTSRHQFSLVKGRDREREEPLINMPPARFTNSVLFNKTKWNNFQLELESDYVFRQNEFPEDIQVFSPEQGGEVLLQINTPPDAYHLFNLNSSVDFDLGNSQALAVSLTARNVFNTRFRDYLDRLRYFADSQGINMILNIKFTY